MVGRSHGAGCAHLDATSHPSVSRTHRRHSTSVPAQHSSAYRRDVTSFWTQRHTCGGTCGVSLGHPVATRLAGFRKSRHAIAGGSVREYWSKVVDPRSTLV